MQSYTRLVLLSLAATGLGLHATAAWSQAALNGQSGLIYMPDARVVPDGTLRLGVSYADPYLSGWSSIGLFPSLEVTGKFTRLQGVNTELADSGD